MAYVGNKLVVRPAYSGLESELGDIWDSLKDIASSVVKGYGDARATQGAADALAQQQQAAAAAASMAHSGPDLTTIAVVGAIGIGALLILKKRKK